MILLDRQMRPGFGRSVEIRRHQGISLFLHFMEKVNSKYLAKTYNSHLLGNVRLLSLVVAALHQQESQGV